MDDGMSGDFSSRVGFSINSLLTTFTTTSGIIKGREHRFRYRARNMIGWGAFSEESSVLAATIPQPPEKPVFSSYVSLSQTLNIEIKQSSDNGGSAI